MSIFACPVCGKKLDRLEKAYLCPDGHSYDIASEGYVHLLPPNKMHAKVPGDCKQMVSARRRFLEAGYYAPFSDRLNALVPECAGEDPVVLDAGCGEGYYTGGLERSLGETGGRPSVFGFDISKYAVKAAAKRYKGIAFAVGSMFGIPVLSGAADCVVNVFAPIVPEELCRVLKPGGSMILAVPGERHLFGLKELLYDDPYENEHRETEYPGFAFVRRVPVRGEITVRGEAVRDLFAMTPYYWKTPVEGSRRIESVRELKTEIAFDFILYRKKG